MRRGDWGSARRWDGGGVWVVDTDTVLGWGDGDGGRVHLLGPRYSGSVK